MFRIKRYVHPFISRKPVRTPLTYIQIDQICRIELGIFAVALCEEGVDRNRVQEVPFSLGEMSPSAKRAWIEIADKRLSNTTTRNVALCEEGVDRNKFEKSMMPALHSRPLRRGRG